MLIRLAAKNGKALRREYGICMVSVMCQVVFLYLLESLRFHPVMNQIIYQDDIKCRVLFRMGTCLLFVFIFLFTVYGSDYMVKKRKEELGMYQLIGFRKGQIVKLLFIEQLTQGLACTVLGILGGMLVEKPVYQGISRLSKSSIVLYHGPVMKAAYYSLAAMIVIFFLAAGRAAGKVSRASLKALFSQETKSVHTSRGTLPGALLGMALMVTGYALILRVHSSANFELGVLGGGTACLLGTFLLLEHTIPYFLAKRRNRKNWQNPGRMVLLANLESKGRRNARNWAILSLFSAATMGILLGAVSLYHTSRNMYQCNYPYTFAYVNSKENGKKAEELLMKSKGNQVTNRVEAKTILIPLRDSQKSIRVVSETQYLELQKGAGRQTKEVHLNKNQGIFLSWGGKKEIKGQRKKMIFEGSKEDKVFSIVKGDDTNYLNLRQEYQALVVSNQDYKSLEAMGKKEMVSLWKLKDSRHTRDLTIKLQQLLGSEGKLYYAYEEAGILEFVGILVLVLLLIGGMYLLSTGSMLCFHVMLQLQEEQDQFRTLYELGMSKKETKMVGRRFCKWSFLIPVGVTLMHMTVCVLFFYRNNMLHSLAVTMGSLMGFGVIYFIYEKLAEYSAALMIQKEIGGKRYE